MNGWTCTRITRTNERMAGLVRLRDFKLDRVQVRPMADVAKLPCDSGFALSACLSLSAPLGLSVSRFTQLRKRQRRKPRKTAATIMLVNVGSYFAYEVQRTKRESKKVLGKKERINQTWNSERIVSTFQRVQRENGGQGTRRRKDPRGGRKDIQQRVSPG